MKPIDNILNFIMIGVIDFVRVPQLPITAFKLSVFNRWTSGLGAFTGLVTRETDENVLNGGFNSASESLRAGGRAYSRGQTGDTHAYLRYLAIGFTLIALAVLLGGRR